MIEDICSFAVKLEASILLPFENTIVILQSLVEIDILKALYAFSGDILDPGRDLIEVVISSRVPI